MPLSIDTDAAAALDDAALSSMPVDPSPTDAMLEVLVPPKCPIMQQFGFIVVLLLQVYLLVLLQSLDRSDILEPVHLSEFKRILEQFVEQKLRKRPGIDW